MGAEAKAMGKAMRRSRLRPHPNEEPLMGMSKKKKKEAMRRILKQRAKALEEINGGVLLITSSLAETVASALEKEGADAEAMAKWHHELTSAGMAFALAGMALEGGAQAVLEAAIQMATSNDMTLALQGKDKEVQLHLHKGRPDEEWRPKGGYA